MSLDTELKRSAETVLEVKRILNAEQTSERLRDPKTVQQRGRTSRGGLRKD